MPGNRGSQGLLGCGETRTVGHLVTVCIKNRFQCGQQGEDVAVASGIAHKADAPGLATELTKPAADLDVVVAQERTADRGVVDPVGDAHGGERVEAVVGVG